MNQNHEEPLVPVEVAKYKVCRNLKALSERELDMVNFEEKKFDLCICQEKQCDI